MPPPTTRAPRSRQATKFSSAPGTSVQPSCRKTHGWRSIAQAYVWSKNSCGFTRVVFQQSPEPFTALKWACTLCILVDRRKEQHVALALMIPLVMKMRHVLRQRMPERGFPKEDEPRETLLLDRPHPALRVGVQIWRSRRQGHPCDPGCVDDLLKGRAVSPVAV